MTEITTTRVVAVTAVMVIAATMVFLRRRSQDSEGGVEPSIRDASSPSSSSSSIPPPTTQPLPPPPSSSSSSSTPPSSSSTCRSWKYDVFLSFRGLDTRKTFLNHMYHALKQRGIVTYKDDVTLDRGDTIGPALLTAIRESQIALIIFSENYANSSWCLEELSYIMKCKEEIDQIVIPVFYNVNSSDVRRQITQWVVTNKSWIKALNDLSNISGWVTMDVADGHEAECIQAIIASILKIFPYSDSVVDDENLVGMKSRLDQLKFLLNIESGGVRMVGIWGVGGGGKTTLAFSAYMKLREHFHGHCFIGNIREKSQQLNGLEKLQETILSEVLKTQESVTSVQEGRCKIQSILSRRNVLIVLDDVDHPEQLKALAGCDKWFGKGSRILITTRDEHLLTTHRIEVSPMSLLSDGEADALFNMLSSDNNKLVPDYKGLSHQIVTYAAGLPLALIVLGSFLYDKDKDEWLSTLGRLKHHPEMGILEKLKISYDGLKLIEKELFLDIACFFKKKRMDKAIEILDACGFYPAIGLKVLKQKALITVSSGGRFDMHDLVQEMAHDIVRGEHPDNPERYSRVWQKEDIEDICSRNATMENDKIEAIECDASGCSLNFITLVSNMKKLRFLEVTTASFEEGPSFLSNKLRYLSWSHYPASPFPVTFQPKMLRILKIEKSLQKELWTGYKYLPCVKVMELCYMKVLVRIPDIGGLQSLQELILKGCDSIEEIHQSLGNRSSLVYLSVIQCDKLKRFPTIVKMDKLKILRILKCKALDEFPNIEAKMDSLVELYLYEVGIQVLPPSVGEYCTNLISLKLEWCSKLTSIQGNFHALEGLKNFHVNSYNLGRIEGNLPRSSLTTLDLSWCKLEDGEIPTEIGELSNLRELHLKCNNFSRLDFSLLRLTHLKLLDLRRCENLVELPELPSSLAILNADGCESLEVIKDDAHKRCKWLCDVSIQGHRRTLSGGERLVESMLQGKAVKNGCMILQLKGLEIPRGFESRVVQGRTCILEVGENWYNHHSGFLFCVVLDNNGYSYDLPKITTRMKHEMLTGELMTKRHSQDDMDREETSNVENTCNSQDGMEWEEPSNTCTSQDDMDWEETSNNENTCMIYVSFGSLRNTAW